MTGRRTVDKGLMFNPGTAYRERDDAVHVYSNVGPRRISTITCDC